MTENTKKRYFFFSPWPFVAAAVLFALVTPRYHSLYGYGHWSVTATAFRIEKYSEILANEILPELSDENENTRKTIESLSTRMKYDSTKLKEVGFAIMRSKYHITGLFSVLFTAFAFFCKPRWPGFLSLPFSLYSMQYFAYVM